MIVRTEYLSEVFISNKLFTQKRVSTSKMNLYKQNVACQQSQDDGR